MKAFHFSLQKVLELREWKEKEAQRDLSRKLSICLGLESQIEDRQKTRARTMLEFTGSKDIASWMAAERFASRLLHEEESLKMDWAVAEEERLKSAQVYREALSQRKALENVREKRYQKYHHDKKIQEVKVQDDQTSARRSRN